MGGIQSQIYAGYGIAAAVLGSPCRLFRPSGPNDPLSGPIATAQAAFDTRPDFSFKQPSTHGNPTWYGLFDASVVRVGDYLVSDTAGTFFVASLEALHPPMLVRCNARVSVLRPAGQQGQGVGKAPYGGSAPDEVLLGGWPASVLTGSKGERSEADLPRSTRHPWHAVLLPACPGVRIRTDDVLTDDLEQRYIVSGAELTGLGWRLSAAFSGV